MKPRRGIAVSCGRVFLGYTHGDWREASRLGHMWQKQRRPKDTLTFREISGAEGGAMESAIAEVATMRLLLDERPQLSDLADAYVRGARESTDLILFRTQRARNAIILPDDNDFARAADAFVKLWLAERGRLNPPPDSANL